MRFRSLVFLFVTSSTLFVTSGTALLAQDSVDVVFRYFPTGNPSVVHVPGEFNNWANNSGGSINPGTRWTMVKQPDGSWEKTVRLKVNGGSAPDDAYEYKFNENGSASGWLADPLNPRTYGSFGNSIIHVRRPTVFHLQPTNGSIISSATPELTADVFPVTTQSIDTGASRVLVDGVVVATFGSGYDHATGRLRIQLPALVDGERTITVIAAEARDYENADSTRITVRAAALQWLSRDNPRVLAAQSELHLAVTATDVTDVVIVRNGTDTIATDENGNLRYATVTLNEGLNVFVGHGQQGGNVITTPPLTLDRFVDHDPRPVIQLGTSSGNVNLNAFASTDPDGDALTFRWISEDGKNPAHLGIDTDGPQTSFPIPSRPGEYYFTLEAKDPAGNTGFTRNYLRIASDGSDPLLGGMNEQPAWVSDAIVYEIFVPAFSARGDLQGVIDGIPHIKALGANTIWLMPIMDNLGTINAFNGGYNIVDFYNVDEGIGTIADFDRLVDSAHANGLRVILDMTPNHVSGSHLWVNDIRDWFGYSIFRPFIESRVLGGDRGLGQSVVDQNGYPLYARYSNWTLANLNLSNPETRDAMMDVYRYWLVDRRADGFRLDVYWGPQERYDAQTWWRPFREEIKRYKPDVFLLGETDGTGQGSEVNYADGGGALDAGYDWSWYGQMKSTLSNGDIASLNSRTTNYSPNENYNHYTGPNASYFRFLENHDEERIASIFQSNIDRSRPGAAVMLTAPGIPLIYAGQEVGWRGQRDRINFSNPPQPALLSYYSKLAGIRNAWASLRSPRIVQVLNGTPGMYAFLRPGEEENIVVAANFRNVPVTVTLDLPEDKLDVSTPPEPGSVWYMNDLMVDSTFSITAEGLSAFGFDLAPYQTRVFVLSDSAHFALVTSVPSLENGSAGSFSLEGSFPNPLPAGSIANVRYTIGGQAGSVHQLRFEVYDVLGREVWRSAMYERRMGTYMQPLGLRGVRPGSYRLRVIATDARGMPAWTASSALTVIR
ncbi:MAG: hypothetical protein KFF77_02810 [Bacteroidetes bacterium]|nr:hypothetical protein [Bacteroidota bacterium]